MTKKCIGCLQEFPKTEFYEKQSRCKTCHKAKTKKYAREHPEIVAKCRTSEHNRKYNLKKYGITPKEWQQMFEQQEGKCACCGVHQSDIKRPLVVDHCHSTGKVRKLLCNHCNSALGYAKEDVEVFKKLIKYVELYCGC